MNPINTPARSYMVIGIAGETFAIPAAAVLSVQQRSAALTSTRDTTGSDNQLPLIPLTVLLQMKDTGSGPHLILISTENHKLIVSVDTLFPIISLTDDHLHPLPALLLLLNLPYSGILTQAHNLIPVLEPVRLAALYMAQRKEPNHA